MDTQTLLKTFGYEIEHLPLYEENIDLEQETQALIERIKDQLQYNKSVLTGIIVPMFVADGEETMRAAKGLLQGMDRWRLRAQPPRSIGELLQLFAEVPK